MAVLKNTWENGEQWNSSDQNELADEVNSKYVKPSTGVPITDMTASVQVSLGRADTAIQSVSSTSITNSTTTGRALITATDASAARTAIGVSYGSAAGTVAQGNDSRFSPSATSITDSTATGRSLLTATDASAARTAIGVAYGTTAGTVVQGNDSRVTGAQQTSQKGQANGYAELDSGGKVPVSQLPNSIMEYQGTYNATTNVPSLTNGGSHNTGDVYRVSVAGSRNFGAGAISFEVGDYAIYNGSVWEKSDTTDAVSTVAGRTGDVTLTVSDIGGNTTTALGVGSLEIGHASDTTLTRSAAGRIAVEGVDVVTTTATQTLENKTVRGYTESTVALGTVGASSTLAITAGSIITATLTASTPCTFTMPPVGAGKSFTLMLQQAATGMTTATFTGVKWPNGGTAPTMTATASRMDVFSFFSNGTSWYGSAAQNYTP